MATEDQTQAVTKIASGAVPIYRAVVNNGEGTAIVTTNPASGATGVSGMAVADGEAFPMNYAGQVKIELGADRAAGLVVSPGAGGVAIIASTVAGETTLGRLATGGVTGDIVSLDLDLRTV